MAETPLAASAYAVVPHGGDLSAAVARFGGPRERWLDLSTGINPHAYPLPELSTDAWRRLPDGEDALAAVAARHYDAPHALPVAGTQAALRALPRLLPRGTVGVAHVTYGEYAPAFAAAGHRVLRFDPYARPDAALPADLRHLIVANPNNPTADYIAPARLLAWRAALQARGGMLIVDEAFADALPALSVAPALNDAPGGLVVLRSFGKFFGLAGLRLGFVLAERTLLDALDAELGPWAVNGPARGVATAALRDDTWRQAMRVRLADAAERLSALLGGARGFGAGVRTTPLFAWAPHPDAAAWHERLARQRVWTRLFESAGALRFGLPADEAQWARLADALDWCRAASP